MKLIDDYGEFDRRTLTCKHCGWSGEGAQMTLGDTFGTGADRNCPKCGERYGFVQWSIVVADDAPDDWPSKVPPVEY